MEEFLNNIYSNSTAPMLSALMLGLMTSIGPCTLAANITAIGFVSKDIENKNKVFNYGLVYTLGRAIAYTGLAFILFVGADQLKISSLFQKYGEKWLGPVLIIIGLFMIGLFNLSLFKTGGLANRFQQKKKHNYLEVLLIGILFALSFCPYSGVMFFGMLIPLSIQSASGLILPVIFAIATGIPVIIFAWLLAYTVSGVGKLYNSLKTFEFWFRKIVAVGFIGVGIYYTIIVRI